jgi:DNA-binding response OmpR family regulator
MLKVLICEQRPILLTVLEYRLRQYGLQMVRARNPSDALRRVHERTVDLVLADVCQPEMNICTFIGLIREDIGSNIPIIVMAEQENRTAIMQALDAGADDFVFQPFRPVELILRIEILLEKSLK